MKNLKQQVLEQQAMVDGVLGLFCNAADNLGDLPISTAWADKWSNEAKLLLDKYGYFRNFSALEFALKAERLAGKIEGLEEAARWFDANHLMILQKGLLWSEELRRMAAELKEEK